MITSKKVFAFVRRLRKIAGGRQKCNMMQVGVCSLKNNTCGSPGCHAGWAYLALVDSDPEEGAATYSKGHKALARFLGFRNTPSLENWANRNPDIWGNGYGAGMFSNCFAFGKRVDIFPASVLADHWEGVGQRLRKHERTVARRKASRLKKVTA